MLLLLDLIVEDNVSQLLTNGSPCFEKPRTDVLTAALITLTCCVYGIRLMTRLFFPISRSSASASETSREIGVACFSPLHRSFALCSVRQATVTETFALSSSERHGLVTDAISVDILRIQWNGNPVATASQPTETRSKEEYVEAHSGCSICLDCTCLSQSASKPSFTLILV